MDAPDHDLLQDAEALARDVAQACDRIAPTWPLDQLIAVNPYLGWINLQYFASTVDNRRWGSGNKTLHNVVGGHIGVFEGNGGDLRIGLPLQSVHDGQRLRHEPLRLSVFIEAPRAGIEAVLARHAAVRDLVRHGWLHLLRLDAEAGRIERLRDGQWLTLCAAG